MVCTNNKGAWLCLLGGLLWAAKMAYDWLGLGRVINRAYPPSDPTDYIEFIIPLLCLGGLYRVTRSYKELLGKAPLMVSVGLILTGAFHFSEAYLIDSNIPFGLIFLFIGHLLMLIGTFLLGSRLRRKPEVSRPLVWMLMVLFTAISCFCLSPFVTGSLANELATAITVGLMIVIGLVWASIGGILVLWGSKDIRMYKGQ